MHFASSAVCSARLKLILHLCSFHQILTLSPLLLQLNGLQIFNVCENNDGAAYAAKARMALTLDKVDLVEGRYPVDVKKYPHVAPTKGKEPVVDVSDDEAGLK